ncbi:2Fe-2S ferredoxin [Paraburkholderia steynii]|uniref:2Fe-2S ferredoxin n=1 Tax=Paraburkholderia steynii TaxID=1245441 RepID=A0A4V2NHB0_9BURK|nr:2Fe-2S ferredoxin [Paraburkholderia steynii]
MPHCRSALPRFVELEDPGSRGFDPAGLGRDTLLLDHRGGEVFAYLDACPHYGGTPMAWRKDAYLNGDGTRIVCHAHGAQFDIATGECLVGPCLGQRLTRLDAAVTEHGDVSVFCRRIQRRDGEKPRTKETWRACCAAQK